MEKLPIKINRITKEGCTLIDSDHLRKVCYIVNKGEETETKIYVSLPLSGRPKKTDEIIDNGKDFVHGFKVVQTASGEYAYVRESDHAVLPYRYDIAFDFNSYGFAIVGKEESVSWIDKSFRYLHRNGNMTKEELDKNYADFNGWQEITNFSKGKIPLSFVSDDRTIGSRVSYFGIDGKLKDFYEYDGKGNSCPRNHFRKGTSFDEKGLAIADGNVLLARGYYLLAADFKKLCEEEDLKTTVREEEQKRLIKK